MRALLAVFVIVLASCASLSWAATIQWVAAGGTPLWSTPGNWDSSTVPTASDDVIINIAGIDGIVEIGAEAAYCKSLTIGGSSPKFQRLTVRVSLTIGSGGATILSNGYLNFASGTISTSGKFLCKDGSFAFVSGTLGGSGSYSFTNLPINTSVAIESTVVVTGSLVAQLGTSLVVININKGSLTVSGKMSSSNAVTVTSLPGALLQVTGTLEYNGGANTNTLTIHGDASISTLSVLSGTVTLADNVTVSTAGVSSGALLTLIGPTLSTRKVASLSGTGTLQISGGTNIFTQIITFGKIQLAGGYVVTNSQSCSIVTLEQTGGEINGGADVSIQTASFNNANIKTPLTIGTINVQGFSSIDSTTVTAVSSLVIASSAQFSLFNGAIFSTSSSALISQNFPFKIVPGAGTLPQLAHNGKWTTTSDLQIMVPTVGAGSYQIGTTGSISISGINFAAGSITSSNPGSFTSVGSTVVIDTIYGSGIFSTQGPTFTVNKDLTAATFTQTNGNTNVGTATITTMNLVNGKFNISGSKVTSTRLNFQGGTLNGAGSTSTTINVVLFAISGSDATKQLQFVSVNVVNITLSCGTAQCQLFTQDVNLVSKSQLGSLALIDKKRYLEERS